MRNFILLIFISLGFFISGCSFVKEKEPKLHVISVYEGSTPIGGDDRPGWARCGLQLNAPTMEQSECEKKLSEEFKEVVINVSDNSSPIILALNAHDRTIWKVNLINNAKINRIILGGTETQKVVGIPENIPIEVYTSESSPCGNCFHAQTTVLSPEELKRITGLDTASFQGRYTGKEFSIFNNMKE